MWSCRCRWTEQHDELAAMNGEVDAAEDRLVAEALPDSLQPHRDRFPGAAGGSGRRRPLPLRERRQGGLRRAHRTTARRRQGIAKRSTTRTIASKTRPRAAYNTTHSTM